MSAPDPIRQLQRIAFLLERAGEPTYRVRAFRAAAATLDALPAAELAERVSQGRLRELAGIGATTELVIRQAAAGQIADYLGDLEARSAGPLNPGGAALLRTIRGDCHTHSDFSDGGSPPAEMAAAAAELGREWIALTDHSPRLTVAHGLSRQRLEAQLELVEQLRVELAPFRLLTGIEVDILDDGRLDQDADLLARLDVVVASVHSHLRMPAGEMTPRMVAAAANPQVDVLGHCTGRMVTGRGRAPSEFDAELVFAACQRFGVAVEVNCRPERLDPPRALLRLAVDSGCLVSLDTDAHAPGQLDWQSYGAKRAVDCGVSPQRNVTSWPVEQVLAWTADHSSAPG